MERNVYINHFKKSINPDILSCIIALTSVMYFEGKTKLEVVDYIRMNLAKDIKTQDFNRHYATKVEIIYNSLVNTENI